MEFITKFDMVDENNFLIWYDDLGNDMTKAFIDNFFALQKKLPFLSEKKNIGLLRARGWLGVNEYHHLNGLIGSMDVEKLIQSLSDL